MCSAGGGVITQWRHARGVWVDCAAGRSMRMPVAGGGEPLTLIVVTEPTFHELMSPLKADA